MVTSTTDTLRQRIEDGCTPVHLAIDDETSHHAGHVGDRAHGGGHYTVLIVSHRFEGQTLVERHRRVYAAVGDLMKQEVHALSMRTLTPQEWSAQ